MWNAVSPWNREHRVKKPVDAPRWSSLSAAILALLDWEAHERVGPSATGRILDRAQRGDTGDRGASHPESFLLLRAGELVRVRQAFEQAYPVGGHAKLTHVQCMRVLASRTPGALAVMPTYDDLAREVCVHAGEVRAVVKHGRISMTIELASRGIIPMPHADAGLSDAIERVTLARERLVAHG